MNVKFIPYLWLWMIASGSLIVAGIYFTIFRKEKRALIFGISVILIALWMLSVGFELTVVEFSTKLFWTNLKYSIYILIFIIWFYMILKFAGMDKWITPRNAAIYMVFPLMTAIFVWFNKFHNISSFGFLYYSSNNFYSSKDPHFWFFLFNAIFIYSTCIVSIVLVVKTTAFYKSIYGIQSTPVIFSPIISIFPTIMYMLSFNLATGYDIAVLAIIILGISAAISGYQLFVVAPVAREAAIENIDIGMIVVDKNDIVEDVNIEACRLLFKEKKLILDAPLKDAISKVDIKLEELRVNNAKIFEIDDNGVNKYYEVIRRPIISKRGIKAGDVILLHDITEIRKARNQIMEQNYKLAASKERERMARDLHDNLAQTLAFINLQAQGIAKMFADSEINQYSEELSKIVNATKSAHNEIRQYIKEIRDSSYTNKNFIKAIQENAEEYGKAAGVTVITDFEEEVVFNELENEQQLNIYYIFMEALNNIKKHAKQLKQIRITIKKDEDSFYAAIEDDGCGFDIQKVRQNHYGILIMQERAAEIKADIKIDSLIGKGTKIEIKFPLMKGGN